MLLNGEIEKNMAIENRYLLLISMHDPNNKLMNKFAYTQSGESKQSLIDVTRSTYNRENYLIEYWRKVE